MSVPVLPTPTAERWRPTPAIKLSLVIQAAAIALLLARPGQWRWALAFIVINHLVLVAAGLWPRSRLLGPNWTRLPPAATAAGMVAITIDDGPDPLITPRVLDLLDQHGVKATFFCVGELVQRHPHVARDIVLRGHCVENHSFRHLHRFSAMTPAAIAAEVHLAQQTIETVTGQRPRFFRAPAGLRNPFLEPVLARSGLRLASWTRRGFDTVTTDAATVAQRLTGGLRSGDIVLLHDGNAARTAAGTPVILEVMPRLLQAMKVAHLTPVTLRSVLRP